MVEQSSHPGLELPEHPAKGLSEPDKCPASRCLEWTQATEYRENRQDDDTKECEGDDQGDEDGERELGKRPNEDRKADEEEDESDLEQ